jgi:hypothetical protein
MAHLMVEDEVAVAEIKQRGQKTRYYKEIV